MQVRVLPGLLQLGTLAVSYMLEGSAGVPRRLKLLALLCRWRWCAGRSARALSGFDSRLRFWFGEVPDHGKETDAIC